MDFPIFYFIIAKLLSQSGCTNLYSQQQFLRVLIAPHPHQQLISSELLNLGAYNGIICISLTNDEIQYLFTGLLAIWISFLLKCLFKVFAPFFLNTYLILLFSLNMIMRSIYWLPAIYAPTGNQTCTPGMCPDWEGTKPATLSCTG